MESYRQKQNSHSKKPFSKFNKYKKNYGSVQEGRSLTEFSKQKIKKNYYLKQKQKFRPKIHQEDEEGPSFDPTPEEDPYAKYQGDREAFDELPSKKLKLSKLKRAQMEYENKIKEKELKRKEREERIKEIEKKKQLSKEKRFQRNIKLTKKTQKGQPLMRSRMEVLLGDIESLISQGK